MKDIFSIISLTKSGNALMIVSGKDDSNKSISLANKSCTSIDCILSEVIKPVIKEVLDKTGAEIKEVIVALSYLYVNVTENRGYIVRDSENDEINESELLYLQNFMFKLQSLASSKLLSIAPRFYSVDDIEGIKSPIGMCGKRLEGTFKVLHADNEIINFISRSITSEGINIKKFIPVPLSVAEPFLTSEEFTHYQNLILTHNS
jgi:cell division protein FtsA